MSASTPGNLDCALALEIKRHVSDVWEESGSIKADYIADVDTAVAVHTSGTKPRMQDISQPDKDRQLKIWWVDDCNETEPADCDGDNCDFDYPEAGTQCVDYALNECFEDGYSWTEDQFRNSEMTQAQFEAPMLLRAMKRMDEKVDRKTIMLLDEAAGVNKWDEAAGGQYAVAGDGTTYVPAAGWNVDLMGYLDMLAWYNKMNTTRVASGTLLKQYMWKVGMESTDPTGASALAKMDSLGGTPSFDRQMDTVLGHKAVFLYNPSSVVIVNRARNSGMNKGRTVQAKGGAPVLWETIASQNIPGIVYDWYSMSFCINGGDVKHVRKLAFRGLFASNPVGCDTDRTGVYKVRCGVAA